MTARLETVRPETLGLCGERLTRIDTHLMNRYIAPQKIAGALTLVARIVGSASDVKTRRTCGR